VATGAGTVLPVIADTTRSRIVLAADTAADKGGDTDSILCVLEEALAVLWAEITEEMEEEKDREVMGVLSPDSVKRGDSGSTDDPSTDDH